MTNGQFTGLLFDITQNFKLIYHSICDISFSIITTKITIMLDLIGQDTMKGCQTDC